MAGDNMKMAFFCEPQIGGTFTFFRRTRSLLAGHGIDFRCIPPVSGELFSGTPFEGIEGVDYVEFPGSDARDATGRLIRHLQDEDYKAIMVLPGTGSLGTNIVRYVPPSIRTFARVPMFTRGAYAPTKALAPHLDAVICVCDRIADDLRERYGISEGKLTVIYNGIDVRDDRAAVRLHGETPDAPLRMIFSGRLWDSHKGVLLLPDILRGLVALGIAARLQVVGTGPDEARLREKFEQYGLSRLVEFAGPKDLAGVGDLLRQADVFIMPSRYEGCPNALLEAMAAGCACVASRLAGSTDRIIEDGTSGLLATVGSVRDFVGACGRLAQDPEKRRRMGDAALRRVTAGFRIEDTVARYAVLIKRVMSEPDSREPPQPLDHYSVPRGMRPTWRTLVPDPVKNALRGWLERLGRST